MLLPCFLLLSADEKKNFLNLNVPYEIEPRQSLFEEFYYFLKENKDYDLENRFEYFSLLILYTEYQFCYEIAKDDEIENRKILLEHPISYSKNFLLILKDDIRNISFLDEIENRLNMIIQNEKEDEWYSVGVGLNIL